MYKALAGGDHRKILRGDPDMAVHSLSILCKGPIMSTLDAVGDGRSGRAGNNNMVGDVLSVMIRWGCVVILSI